MIRLSPSLSWVPWSEFPSFLGTIRELRLPAALPPALRFLARKYRTCYWPGDGRASQVPWGAPLANTPRSQTPAGRPALAFPDESMLPPGYTHAVGPTTHSLSGLYHAACLLAVYASWDGLLRRCTQDSLPACWLGFDRMGLSPTGLQSRLSRWHRLPPFLSSQASPGAPAS